MTPNTNTAFRNVLTGLPELEAAMKHLSTKAADRVSAAALGGGGSLLAREIRKKAPKDTGRLRKSIKYRFIKRRRGRPAQAKAGVNVGKQKKDSETGEFITTGGAPHAHLVALGTKRRTRESLGGKFAYIKNPSPLQLLTGRTAQVKFVERGTSAAASKMLAAMKKRAAKALEREARKGLAKL